MILLSKIMRIARWPLIAIAIGCGYYFGRELQADDLLRLNNGLRNTALAVVAVVGAWIAFVFPKALDRYAVQRTDGVENSAHVQISYLKRALLLSLAVAVFSIGQSWAIELFKSVRGPIGPGIVAGIITAGYLAQVYALLLVAIPVIEAGYDLERRKAIRRSESKVVGIKR